jgi:ABC-2 type transport system permease protein
MKPKKNRQQNIRKAASVNLLLVIILVVLSNLISSFIFKRFDLTAEKRFTLDDHTVGLLEELDDIIYVKVYLEGELPAGYQRLRNATREMLDEFRAYNKYIEYEFINPSAGSNEKERKAVYQQLMQEGLTYTTPVEQKDAGLTQTLIWPGALVTYRNKTIPLQLLKSKTYRNEEEMISRSVSDLEYELTNAIRKLKTTIKPSIAFIEGHGEFDTLKTYDITNALREYYIVERVRIDSQLNSLVNRSEKGDSNIFYPRYKAIVIAGPDSAFSEKDKFIIDQYLMRGGRVLWLFDKVHASMDSLGQQSSALVYPKDLNLDDMLFRYGVRVNANLLLDLRSASIPLVTGQVGNQPRMRYFRWFYFPLSLPSTRHPVVNNLNAIKFEFASSIDTLESPGIGKTVLLTGSKRTQLINTPARISLNILREEPDPSVYNKSAVPLAVLLEGRFDSHFRNFRNDLKKDDRFGFLPKAVKSTAMIVIGDADVIRNGYSSSSGKIVPLGYDKYTGELFGNRDFLVNCVNYLCDDSGLISVRSRNVEVRLLDDARIKSERLRLNTINVAVPVLIFLSLGLVLVYIRRRKYSFEKKQGSHEKK